jgi:hypothetical protein
MNIRFGCGPFYAAKERIGLGLTSMREGYVLAVFLGDQLPSVQRPAGMHGCCRANGDYYM